MKRIIFNVLWIELFVRVKMDWSYLSGVTHSVKCEEIIFTDLKK